MTYVIINCNLYENINFPNNIIIMENSNSIFYVVTESGGVYKVCVTEASASIEKIFLRNLLENRLGLGYKLGPEMKFVGITKRWGLWKFSSDDDKKPEYFNGGQWEGSHIHTSLIAGLFFREFAAIDFCKKNYGNYDTKEWYLQEQSREVLEEVKDHPLVLVEE